MRRSISFLVIALLAAATYGSRIDMKDPRRAVGMEDGVRVDAQLTKTLTAGAMVKSSSRQRQMAGPAFVQIRVSLLRDAAPFTALRAGVALTDDDFDQWLELNESIVLNTIPVRYRAQETQAADASRR